MAKLTIDDATAALRRSRLITLLVVSLPVVMVAGVLAVSMLRFPADHGRSRLARLEGDPDRARCLVSLVADHAPRTMLGGWAIEPDDGFGHYRVRWMFGAWTFSIADGGLVTAGWRGSYDFARIDRCLAAG